MTLHIRFACWFAYALRKLLKFVGGVGVGCVRTPTFPSTSSTTNWTARHACGHYACKESGGRVKNEDMKTDVLSLGTISIATPSSLSTYFSSSVRCSE